MSKAFIQERRRLFQLREPHLSRRTDAIQRRDLRREDREFRERNPFNAEAADGREAQSGLAADRDLHGNVPRMQFRITAKGDSQLVTVTSRGKVYNLTVSAGCRSVRELAASFVLAEIRRAQEKECLDLGVSDTADVSGELS